MRRILLVLFAFLFCSNQNIIAQTLVWDVVAMEALITNHKVQHESFSQMKQEEAAIAALQKSISLKIAQIEVFQSKFYNSLKSIEAITKTGKDIVYASDIVKDIVEYQGEMLEYAADDPQLLLVAVKTEAELVKRTADLMTYIYQVAIIGTDVNLMNNKQRLNLLNHVISELRIMRGIAYSVVRQMKTAARNGIIETIYPGGFKYKDNRGKLVDQILREFEVNTR